MPTATIVTDAFLFLARTEAKNRGVDDLPLIRVPHPVGTISLQALRSLAEATVDAIVAALTSPNVNDDTDRAEANVAEDERAITQIPADPGQMFDIMAARGWTDGLPVLPPTPAAVAAMVEASGLEIDFTLGLIPPLNGIATVEKIAANAVMAGCLPQYFAILLTALECVMQPGFNLDGVQTTTGNVAPLTIVNGPCRNSLNINYSANVLGQGWRANATIGRALRLVLSNIGGATPGLYDKATLGQPAKYTFCIGENEEENPWEPLHAECGLSRAIDAVSVFGCSGVNSAVDMASQSAKGLLRTFALTMIGGLPSGVTSTEVMLIICPEHARLLASSGYAKTDIKKELFALARVPHENISDENLALLANRRPLWFGDGVREIAAVDRPDDIWIVVAGGPGAKSAYLPGRTGTHLQTKPIKYAGQTRPVKENGEALQNG